MRYTIIITIIISSSLYMSFKWFIWKWNTLALVYQFMISMNSSNGDQVLVKSQCIMITNIVMSNLIIMIIARGKKNSMQLHGFYICPNSKLLHSTYIVLNLKNFNYCDNPSNIYVSWRMICVQFPRCWSWRSISKFSKKIYEFFGIDRVKQKRVRFSCWSWKKFGTKS